MFMKFDSSMDSIPAMKKPTIASCSSFCHPDEKCSITADGICDASKIMKTLTDHFSVPDLIHSTFRYCLGRQTAYAVTFAHDLAEAWPLLPPSISAFISVELDDAFAEDDLARDLDWADRPLGHDVYRAAWGLVRRAYQ
jgi:hypothetical protein